MTSGSLTVTTPSDREIEVTRAFDAPRTVVFDAYTKPELVKRWFGGPEGWSLAECVVDLRVGGEWRYVLRHVDGMEMGFGGVYREVVAPERLVTTERYDHPWYPGEALNTLVLTEVDGSSILTLTLQYESKAARDVVLASPMEAGLAAGFDHLAEFLAADAGHPLPTATEPVRKELR